MHHFGTARPFFKLKLLKLKQPLEPAMFQSLEIPAGKGLQTKMEEETPKRALDGSESASEEPLMKKAKAELADEKNLGPADLDSMMHLKMEASSVDTTAWTNTPIDMETFKDVALKCGQTWLKAYGGPRQFLNKEFNSPAEFYTQLRKFMGTSRADIKYLDALPNDDAEIFAVNLWDLSYHEASSTKPAPFLTTSLLLLDEILTGGFTTKSHLATV